VCVGALSMYINIMCALCMSLRVCVGVCMSFYINGCIYMYDNYLYIDGCVYIYNVLCKCMCIFVYVCM